MSLYSKYKTDLSAEVKGVDVNVDDGVTIRVARICERNKAYKAARAKIEREFERELQFNEAPEGYTEALTRAFAEHIITGWEGVTDENGKELKYTVDNAVKLLTDLPDLMAELVAVSLSAEHFNSAKLGELVKK